MWRTKHVITIKKSEGIWWRNGRLLSAYNGTCFTRDRDNCCAWCAINLQRIWIENLDLTFVMPESLPRYDSIINKVSSKIFTFHIVHSKQFSLWQTQIGKFTQLWNGICMNLKRDLLSNQSVCFLGFDSCKLAQVCHCWYEEVAISLEMNSKQVQRIPHRSLDSCHHLLLWLFAPLRLIQMVSLVLGLWCSL